MAWLILLAVAALATAARANVVDLTVRNADGTLWLVRTDQSDRGRTTSIRRQADPVAGTWTEIARIDGGIIDAAPVAGRLAVLGEAGDWQLLWAGNGMAGPPPPDGWTLRSLASSDTTLWAVATRDADPPAMLRWSESDGWSVAGPLADGVDVGSASLGVAGDKVWLTWTRGTAVHVARFEQGHWAEPFRPLTHGVASVFVDHATRPTLAVRDADGRLTFWAADATPPGPIREPIDATPPVGLAMVGPTLRVFTAKGDTVEQTTIDGSGRGLALGPTLVADPIPANPRQFEWVNVLVLAVLTVAMLRTMRTSPETLPTLPAAWRPAPLWRRAGATLIDASPMLASSAWLLAHFQGTPEELRHASDGFFLPAYLGLMAYIAHVSLCEARFGRSIGKWAFGLRVVSIDGGPAGGGQILLRNLMRVLELALFLPALLPLVSPAGQRIGDMAARTVVVAAARQTQRPAESDAPSSDSA